MPTFGKMSNSKLRAEKLKHVYIKGNHSCGRRSSRQDNSSNFDKRTYTILPHPEPYQIGMTIR